MTPMATAPPTISAPMKPGTDEGAIPAKVSENIRATVRDLESSLGLAMDNLPPVAADERLRHVIETLSEMQGDFVAALRHPEAPSAFSGGAAVRVRQRYTRAAAPTV